MKMIQRPQPSRIAAIRRCQAELAAGAHVRPDGDRDAWYRGQVADLFAELDALAAWRTRWKALAKAFFRIVRIHRHQAPPTASGYMQLFHQREAWRPVVQAAEALCLARDWDMAPGDDPYVRALVDAISKAKGAK